MLFMLSFSLSTIIVSDIENSLVYYSTLHLGCEYAPKQVQIWRVIWNLSTARWKLAKDLGENNSYKIINLFSEKLCNTAEHFTRQFLFFFPKS